MFVPSLFIFSILFIRRHNGIRRLDVVGNRRMEKKGKFLICHSLSKSINRRAPSIQVDQAIYFWRWSQSDLIPYFSLLQVAQQSSRWFTLRLKNIIEFTHSGTHTDSIGFYWARSSNLLVLVFFYYLYYSIYLISLVTTIRFARSHTALFIRSISLSIISSVNEINWRSQTLRQQTMWFVRKISCENEINDSEILDCDWWIFDRSWRQRTYFGELW